MKLFLTRFLPELKADPGAASRPRGPPRGPAAVSFASVRTMLRFHTPLCSGQKSPPATKTPRTWGSTPRRSAAHSPAGRPGRVQAGALPLLLTGGLQPGPEEGGASISPPFPPLLHSEAQRPPWKGPWIVLVPLQNGPLVPRGPAHGNAGELILQTL